MIFRRIVQQIADGAAHMSQTSLSQASVHRTLAFDCSNLSTKEKTERAQALSVFWSECRDSNSRPLEPHSSAIPNFATPGNSLSFDCQDILAQHFEKCKSFLTISEEIINSVRFARSGNSSTHRRESKPHPESAAAWEFR